MTFATDFCAFVKQVALADARAMANPGVENADLDTLTRCDWCGAVTEEQPSAEHPTRPWRGLCHECQRESLNEPAADFAPANRPDVDVEDPDDEC